MPPGPDPSDREPADVDPAAQKPSDREPSDHEPADPEASEASDRDPKSLHPFLRPLWRRILILALCVAWIGFEVVYGAEELWLLLAIGMTVYALWDFFLRIPIQRRTRR